MSNNKCPSDKKRLQSRKKFVYNNNWRAAAAVLLFKAIKKPVIKSSSFTWCTQRAADGGNAVAEGIVNGLMRAAESIFASSSRRDPCPLSERLTYWCKKRAVGFAGNLGGTAGFKSCPISAIRLFLFVQRRKTYDFINQTMANFSLIAKQSKQ